jgi:hypothetical protein
MINLLFTAIELLIGAFCIAFGLTAFYGLLGSSSRRVLAFRAAVAADPDSRSWPRRASFLGTLPLGIGIFLAYLAVALASPAPLTMSEIPANLAQDVGLAALAVISLGLVLVAFTPHWAMPGWYRAVIERPSRADALDVESLFNKPKQPR